MYNEAIKAVILKCESPSKLFDMENKMSYLNPLAEICTLRTESVVCASNGGSTEDFGNGTGFSFDLFENVKPF